MNSDVNHPNPAPAEELINQTTSAGTTEPITAIVESASVETSAPEAVVTTVEGEAAAAPVTSEPVVDHKPHAQKRGKQGKNRNKGKPQGKSGGAPKQTWRDRQCADPRWEPLKAAFAANDTIMVTIKAVANKIVEGKVVGTTGFHGLCENGLQGFLPQGETPRGVRHKDILDKTIGVKVERLELDPAKGGPTLIFSRVKAMKEEQSSFHDSLVPGKQVTAKVTGEHEHGYFTIVFDEGVAPASAKAWISKKHAEGELKEHQTVQARVFSNADGKVNLTMLSDEELIERARNHERHLARVAAEEQRKQQGGGRENAPRSSNHAGSGKRGNGGNRTQGNSDQRGKRQEQPGQANATVTTAAPVGDAPAAQQEPAKKVNRPRIKRAKPVNLSQDGGIRSDNFSDFGRLWMAKHQRDTAAAPADGGDTPAQTDTTVTAPAAVVEPVNVVEEAAVEAATPAIVADETQS